MKQNVTVSVVDFSETMWTVTIYCRKWQLTIEEIYRSRRSARRGALRVCRRQGWTPVFAED